MANRKNLVLGGSGTIGSVLCKTLLEKGEEVINLDLKMGFDLRKESLLQYDNVDYVWFLAWEVGGAKFLYNKNHYFDIIHNNTLICQNVFTFLNKTKIPFMFTSSQLASTNNTYGVTKILGEEWTKILGGKIVRFWNIYSWEEPSEKSHFIPDIIINALRNKKITLMTNGEEKRQLIYINDCIDNLLHITTLNGTMFHLTNNKWISIADVANIIANKLNVKIQKGNQIGYQCIEEADESHKYFTFKTDLHEGLHKIIESAKLYLK